jgi:hypothetical protein
MCCVESVVKRFAETGGLPAEGRGGDHVSKKYEERKDSAMKFFLRSSDPLKLIIAEVQHQSECICHLS